MDVLTASEMYAYEQEVINHKKVPVLVLMECAARAVVRQMKERITSADKILVVAGSGNNGGDGLAVGRILHNEGFEVTILELGDPNQRSDQNKRQHEIAQNYGVSLVSEIERVSFNEFTIFVDALFGIGLSRKIEGTPLAVIQKINQLATKYVYAIDVPSGISANEGTNIGTCLNSDETITFGFHKFGMEKPGLKDVFGKITIDDIGFFY
ncbi:MAG TPA: NAD(P)H-hydrate epimerase [Candidatus Tetragenococcus pullicola]|nr:NAD(P)H-hydrate epimerase [Candidatus Tetragenococcus pullicola]